MTDTRETPERSTLDQTPRRRFLVGTAVVAFIAGVAASTGVQALAHGGPGRWHHAGFLGAPLDPATLDQHLDRMLGHLYVEIGATDAQKQQLEPIVKAAARDLLPLRAQIRDARRQGVELLTQASVDRAALETLRAQQVKLIEQASRRLVQALADVADVLTPEQKQELANRVSRWHGPRG